MGSPEMTMWKWHRVNSLDCLPASKLEDFWVHKLIAAESLGKSHISEDSQTRTILSGVSRHRNNNDLVRYGDLMVAHARKAKGSQYEEAAQT